MLNDKMWYRITYGYDQLRLGSNRGYLVELGDSLQQMPKSIQKRWARRQVEKHFGCPVKNPTQKNAKTRFYFKTTVEREPGKWFIYICDPYKET